MYNNIFIKFQLKNENKNKSKRATKIAVPLHNIYLVTSKQQLAFLPFLGPWNDLPRPQQSRPASSGSYRHKTSNP